LLVVWRYQGVASCIVHFSECLIQPAEKLPLPDLGILRTQYPMVLIGQVQQPALDAQQLGCLERFKTLLDADTVILAPLDDHDGRIPLVYAGDEVEVGICLFVALLPIWSAKVFIGKEELFSGAVPTAHIK